MLLCMHAIYGGISDSYTMMLLTPRHRPQSTGGQEEWESLQATQVANAPDGLDAGLSDIMKDLMTSVPGIDEAMAFAELMKMVRNRV